MTTGAHTPLAGFDLGRIHKPDAACAVQYTNDCRRAATSPMARYLRAGPVAGSHGSNDPSRIGTTQPVLLPHGLAMVRWTDDFKLFSPFAPMASFVLAAFTT